MSDPSFPSSPDEPQSLSGSHSSESVAPAPEPPTTNLDADITDELTDHLSLAARDLQLAGHTPDEAQQLAQQRFGDIAAIHRRLWWIQKGDEVMLRIAIAAVLVILVVAVAAIGVGGWQMNQTIGELGDTLATMNETQRALLASREKEDRPLAIRGRLYVKEKSQPARYAAVDVYSLPEGKKVETLMADQDGRFGTSSLPAGHYALVSNLLLNQTELKKPEHQSSIFYAVQSRPISVYPWAKDATVELDVAMVGYGQVSFELARPFPAHIQVKKDNIRAQVFPALVIAIPIATESLPIRNLRGADDIEWPVIGLRNRGEAEMQVFDCQGILGSDGSPPEHMAPLLAGKPFLYERIPGTSRGDVCRVGEYSVEAFITCQLVTDHFGAITGNQAIGDETGYTSEARPAALPDTSRAAIKVLNGRRAHIRITPPDDLEQTLRAEIEQALGDDKKHHALQLRRRPVKVEFAGQLDTLELQELSSRPGGPYAKSEYAKPGDPAGGFGGAF